MSQWLPPAGHFPPPQPPYSTFQGPPPPVPSNQYLPSYQRPSLPPPSQAPSLDDLSLAFDNLAMALRLTAGPQEIDDFQVTLGMLMHDCSQSNIQRGKTWIFNHCSSPSHYEVLLRFIIALSRSRTVFEDKLHLIYLVNDVLFHSERRQEPWIKEALHPNLLALLRSAFHFIDANEKQQEKVLKIISIWGDKHYFDDAKINALKSGVMVPPPPPGGPPSVTFPGMAPPGHPAFGHIRYQNPQNVSPFYNQGAPPPPTIFPGAHSPAQSIISSSTHLSPPIAHGHLRPNSEPAPPGIPNQFPSGPSPPDMSMQGIAPRPTVSVTPPIPAVPEKKYYELPAGLMVPAVSPEDPPYTPIHATSIRLPPHRLPPTPELLDAVDKFYEGLKFAVLQLQQEQQLENIIIVHPTGARETTVDVVGQEIEVIQDQGLVHGLHQGLIQEKVEDVIVILIHQVVVVVAQEVASVIDAAVKVILAQDQALDIGIRVIAEQDMIGEEQNQKQEGRLGRDLQYGKDLDLDRYRYLALDPGLHLGQDQDPMNEAEVEVTAVNELDKSQVNMSQRHAKVIKVDRGIGYVKERDEGARADKMIADHNVGFQMLKKLGWEGAGTGLGSSTLGITEPIKGGEVRLGEQKYLGVGHNQGDEDDIFDQYRKAKSYTYQRSDVNSKDKKPAGCFRCGKPGHIARECPD
ncbi:22134_t:CDS:10 [Dentiscutata erythropus]|uniref:22134_t:CDS:1 n=1 Tax=Dentiscutata erythropus TaxID=1348616 RepID=A0A9N9GFQ2_9GLOM|nr:22134_t:CDS:10 [Dentiscutata erythropus]